VRGRRRISAAKPSAESFTARGLGPCFDCSSQGRPPEGHHAGAGRRPHVHEGRGRPRAYLIGTRAWPARGIIVETGGQTREPCIRRRPFAENSAAHGVGSFGPSCVRRRISHFYRVKKMMESRRPDGVRVAASKQPRRRTCGGKMASTCGQAVGSWLWEEVGVTCKGKNHIYRKTAEYTQAKKTKKLLVLRSLRSARNWSGL